MDYGLFHIVTHKPGAFSYNEPLKQNQVEVYEDGKRYIYEVSEENRWQFKQWVIAVFSKYDDDVSFTDDLTTYYVGY